MLRVHRCCLPSLVRFRALTLTLRETQKHGRSKNFPEQKYFQFRFRSVPVRYPSFDGKFWIYIKNWVGKSLWSIIPKVSVSHFTALERLTYLPSFCPVLLKRAAILSEQHVIQVGIMLRNGASAVHLVFKNNPVTIWMRERTHRTAVYKRWRETQKLRKAIQSSCTIRMHWTVVIDNDAVEKGV